MNSSSWVVTLIVVAAFGVGVLVGRASMPGVQAAQPVAVAPAPTPFPSPGLTGPAPHPMPSSAGEGSGGESRSGTVAEVLQVPNFTYLRLSTDHGDEWAAVPTTNSLAVGQKATLAHANKMVGFTSKTLGRTFDEIWFGELGSN
jgi:hypothetical protein